MTTKKAGGDNRKEGGTTNVEGTTKRRGEDKERVRTKGTMALLLSLL
jgi:hypothetical protein